MTRLFLLMVMMSATILTAGLWIPFKAVVAQELLELAWAESQARQTETRPWPWADTWPVARLSLPELGQSMIVLEGAHGESLAFGPGQVLGNAAGPGPVVIAGHRDTHFSSLRHLEQGSELKLQTRSGRWYGYRVDNVRVVDSRYERIDTGLLDDDTLLLVTCFPFDSFDNRGPLRYVVEARSSHPPVGGNEHDPVQIDTVAGL
ncbi:transpeptidase [Marinobacter lipolyticus SM19]|uniref:Transpeptidase n=1 Tax=Marinobacter lipolyticus SM19 TaxID=1318628 RepID=R8B329_9GAMM|nr:class GN sortase [Marinobacter lipolyticus]EON92998.1 transpeptidase [Marinobacter lipolyticus SM19]